LRLPTRLDLEAILAPLRTGRDPSWQRLAGGWAKASRTPSGPGVEALVLNTGQGVLRQRAWGPGADWLAQRLLALIGHTDDDTGFEPPAPLTQIWREHRGWRVPATGLVLETLVPVILAQKVTGKEAAASYRRLMLSYGEAVAFGPWPDLLLPPAPRVWAHVPSWQWHRAGVGPERSRAVVTAAGRAASLERLCARPSSDAQRALQSLPGIGQWTAAEVAQRVFGDADAISVGDFHIAKGVVFALTGERNGTDEQMLALVAPYAPHRFRIQRLVELGGLGPPRRGPRFAGRDYRDI
jgi:3-methyladenine DNA glycosylase/8-oxoguanine DNA glycosylase